MIQNKHTDLHFLQQKQNEIPSQSFYGKIVEQKTNVKGI